MSKSKQKNVFGEPLEDCSHDPLTGWYRDGCCNTDDNDRGFHTVCVKVSNEFLIWSKKVGNDLITPHPEFGFPDLKRVIIGVYVLLGLRRRLMKEKLVQFI